MVPFAHQYPNFRTVWISPSGTPRPTHDRSQRISSKTSPFRAPIRRTGNPGCVSSCR